MENTSTKLNITDQVVFKEGTSVLPAPSRKFSAAMGSVGFAGGIIYAFNVKSGFLLGWGYAILGGIIGTCVGAGVDSFVNENK